MSGKSSGEVRPRKRKMGRVHYVICIRDGKNGFVPEL